MKFRCSRFAFFWVAVFVFTSIASAAASNSCTATGPGWVTTTPDGWFDIFWDGQPGNQIAQCQLYLTTPLTEIRLLDAYTSGDMYKVDITGAQTMTLYTSRVPLSATDDLLYIYAIQVWWNLDAAWTLEKHYSRLAIWVPPGNYTVTISLYRPAADQDTSTLLNPVWFSRGEVFLRAASFGAPEGVLGVNSLPTGVGVLSQTARPARKWANGGPPKNTKRP
jgi:hypothetical protein